MERYEDDDIVMRKAGKDDIEKLPDGLIVVNKDESIYEIRVYANSRFPEMFCKILSKRTKEGKIMVGFRTKNIISTNEKICTNDLEYGMLIVELEKILDVMFFKLDKIVSGKFLEEKMKNYE